VWSHAKDYTTGRKEASPHHKTYNLKNGNNLIQLELQKPSPPEIKRIYKWKNGSLVPVSEYTTGITKAKSPYYTTERTRQIEDRSLVPSGTVQIEG
jgi:hypothetical protein